MADPVIDVHLGGDDHAAQALRHDVWVGLRAEPKWLPPRWFYDTRGSALFEDITRLPEYYPTRAETQVLRSQVTEIAHLTKARTVVELGAGSSAKTRLLLDALTSVGSLCEYVPQDVSESALREAATRTAECYPDLRVHAVVSDFTDDLEALPGDGPRLVAFLGGTIGNFAPAERAGLLASVGAVLEPGEWLLLGTDLVKDPAVLVAAYDDARGVTAEFNRNVLRVVNRELRADFQPEAFEHVAVWDAEQEWIEMRLRAGRDMQVRVTGLGMRVSFTEGEDLRTEISAKFRREGVEKELALAGFEVHSFWTDSEGRFALSLAQRLAGP